MPSVSPTVQPSPSPTYSMDSFVQAQEVLITIPHTEVPSSIESLKVTAGSMAKALGLDPEQVEIGTIYLDNLFDEEASGVLRRLTEYIIIGYLIFLLQNQQVGLSGTDLADAFIAQVQLDLNIVYSAQVMDTVDYDMFDGFMKPTAIPRCMGAADCWNLQEGDGYCTLDDHCQSGLKCGTANCMDFRDKGNSDYYQLGGWADGGNCCYDELMFAAEVAADGELILYIFIGGGLLALCLMCSMLYWIRRSSKKGQMIMVLDAKEDVDFDNWTTTADKDLAAEGIVDRELLVLHNNQSSGFCSTEQEHQEGEGEGREKVSSISPQVIVLPQQPTCGMQGEMSELRLEYQDNSDVEPLYESVYGVPKDNTSQEVRGELSVMTQLPFNREKEKVIPPLPVSADGTSKGVPTEIKVAENIRVPLTEVGLSQNVESIESDGLPTPGIEIPGDLGVGL